MGVGRCVIAIVVVGWALALTSGCASTSVNQVRLIGSTALDLSGSYPKTVAFERGGFAEAGGAGSAILIGPNAALLFDFRGAPNRFELLLRQGTQSILYRRLEQRPVMTGDGQRVRRPAGVHVAWEGNRLTGSFDVVVGREDLRGFGPAFEHYPKYLRVVGEFSVPRCPEPVGPTTRPAFWEPPSTVTDDPGPPGLDDIDVHWLMDTFAADMPALGETE